MWTTSWFEWITIEMNNVNKIAFFWLNRLTQSKSLAKQNDLHSDFTIRAPTQAMRKIYNAIDNNQTLSIVVGIQRSEKCKQIWHDLLQSALRLESPTVFERLTNGKWVLDQPIAGEYSTCRNYRSHTIQSVGTLPLQRDLAECHCSEWVKRLVIKQRVAQQRD